MIPGANDGKVSVEQDGVFSDFGLLHLLSFCHS